MAPDGTSSQVSAGILNLTHRRSHERPEPLEPGRVEEVRVPLRPAGYRFVAGHRHPGLGGVVGLAGRSGRRRIRRPSSSTAAPRPRRGSILPVDPAGAAARATRPVPAFKTTPPDLRDGRRRGRRRRAPVWRIEEDVIARHVTVTIHDGGEDVLEDGRRLYAAETLRLTASDAEPARRDASTPTSSTAGTEPATTSRSARRSCQTSDAEAFDLARRT